MFPNTLLPIWKGLGTSFSLGARLSLGTSLPSFSLCAVTTVRAWYAGRRALNNCAGLKTCNEMKEIKYLETGRVIIFHKFKWVFQLTFWVELAVTNKLLLANNVNNAKTVNRRVFIVHRSILSRIKKKQSNHWIDVRDKLRKMSTMSRSSLAFCWSFRKTFYCSFSLS